MAPASSGRRQTEKAFNRDGLRGQQLPRHLKVETPLQEGTRSDRVQGFSTRQLSWTVPAY